MKRLLALLALAPLLPACSSFGPKPQWTPYEVPMVSTMRLWEITRLSMEKNGFPVIHEGFDPKDNVAISGWDKDLHPFKGKGFRERVHIRYKRSDNAGKLILGVRVEHENNENLAKPLDASYADWVPGPDNSGRAKVVLQYIESLVGPEFEVGKKVENDPRNSINIEGDARSADPTAPKD